jgi:hypothetical protein
MKQIALGALTLVGALLPWSAGAEPARPLDFTIDEARAAFAAAGYVVESSNSETTFSLHNHAHDRVLLVTVYRDPQQAQLGLHRTPSPASTWIHNLTLVESVDDDFEQRAATLESVDAEFIVAVFAGP